MVEPIPMKEELMDLLGKEKFQIWNDIIGFIENNYEMDALWTQSKSGDCELKYRRSGKTLCALYPKKNNLEILIIFGKNEREKFEEQRRDFSEYTNHLYDNTRQYHDGRWMYIQLEDQTVIEDIKKMILIKKKPNKKMIVVRT